MTELMKGQSVGRHFRQEPDKTVTGNFNGNNSTIIPANPEKESAALNQQLKGAEVKPAEQPIQEHEPQAAPKNLLKYKVDKGAIIRLFGKPVVLSAPMYFSTEADLYCEVTNKTLLRGFYVMEDVDWKPLFTE